VIWTVFQKLEIPRVIWSIFQATQIRNPADDLESFCRHSNCVVNILVQSRAIWTDWFYRIPHRTLGILQTHSGSSHSGYVFVYAFQSKYLMHICCVLDHEVYVIKIIILLSTRP